MKIPLVGQAYTSRSLNLASQQCINLYAEVSEVDNSISALFGTPGLRKLTTLPNTGGTRGGYVPASGKAIVVQGDKVYRIDGKWNYIECPGTLLTKKGYVSISDNGTTAVLVDGKYGYTLDLATNVLARIDSDAFYGADRVGFISGYFVFNKPDTQVFYWSDLYSTNFDALNFASTEGNPDLLVSLIVDHSEVWFFNDTSSEVYVVTGNPDQPIERMSGAFIEHGCAAPHSVAKLDNTVFWVGKDSNGNGTIWRANGYTPQRISTHAIEYALQSYSQINDAIAYTYQQDGHAFYVLTFPQAKKTWCYDVSTGGWHERAYRNTSTGEFERHRSNWHIFFAGTHVVGDWEDGRIYALDPDCYTDDGDPLVSVRTAAVVSAQPNRLFHNCLTLDIEEGVGLSILSAADFDPDAADLITSAGGWDWPVYVLTGINNAVAGLKSGGYWDKFDRFGIMEKGYTQTFGLMDWKSTSKGITLHGTATWSAASGYVGTNTAGAYGDTGFIPSVDGVNFTLDSASFGAYVKQFGTKGTLDYIGGGASGAVDPVTEMYTDSSSTRARSKVNTNGATTAGSFTIPASALMVAQREAAGVVKIYADGVDKTTAGGTNASTTLPTNSLFLGAGNGNGIGAGTAYSPTDVKLSAWWAGGVFTAAEQLAIKAIIDTYLAAV